MKCLIVSGGSKPDKQLFEYYYSKCDYTIAADKGCELFFENNVLPDIIIGDFDSVNNNVLEYFKNIKTIEFPCEKDDTDTALAVKKAIEKGSEEIFVLGGTGSRLDHVFSNMGLIKYCLLRDIRCTLIDNNNMIFMINKPTKIKNLGYKYFSLQSFSEDVTNLTIKNAKYSLNNYNLKLGEGLTVSNEFINDDVEISFSSGIIIVFYTKD